MSKVKAVNLVENFDVITKGEKSYFIDEELVQHAIRKSQNVYKSLTTLLNKRYDPVQTDLILKVLTRKEVFQ
jgi:hypothetical protein